MKKDNTFLQLVLHVCYTRRLSGLWHWFSGTTIWLIPLPVLCKYYSRYFVGSYIVYHYNAAELLRLPIDIFITRPPGLLQSSETVNAGNQFNGGNPFRQFFIKYTKI